MIHRNQMQTAGELLSITRCLAQGSHVELEAPVMLIVHANSDKLVSAPRSLELAKKNNESLSPHCAFTHSLTCQVSCTEGRFPQLALVPRSPRGCVAVSLHPGISAVICPPPVGGVRHRGEEISSVLQRPTHKGRWGSRCFSSGPASPFMLLPLLPWRDPMQRAACVGKGINPEISVHGKCLKRYKSPQRSLDLEDKHSM